MAIAACEALGPQATNIQQKRAGTWGTHEDRRASDGRSSRRANIKCQCQGLAGFHFRGGGGVDRALRPDPPPQKGSIDGTPQNQPGDVCGSNDGGICVSGHKAPGQFWLHMYVVPHHGLSLEPHELGGA